MNQGSVAVEVHGTTIVASAAHPLVLHAVPLLEGLRSAAPEDIRSGFTFRVGWSLYELMVDEYGITRLAVPDYRRGVDIRRRVTDLTTALSVQADQDATLAALGVEDGVPAEHHQKVVLDRRALEADHLYLLRQRITESDSGWHLGVVSDEQDEADQQLEGLYVHELLHLFPFVMPLLSLPVGYVAEFIGGRLTSVSDHDETVHEGPLAPAAAAAASITPPEHLRAREDVERFLQTDAGRRFDPESFVPNHKGNYTLVAREPFSEGREFRAGDTVLVVAGSHELHLVRRSAPSTRRD